MTPPDLFALVRRAARGLLVDARSVGRSGWSQNRLRKAPSRPSRSSGSSPPRGPRSRPVEGLPSGPRTGSGSGSRIGSEIGPSGCRVNQEFAASARSARSRLASLGFDASIRASLPAQLVPRQPGPACQLSPCRVSQGQPSPCRVSQGQPSVCRVTLPNYRLYRSPYYTCINRN